MALSRRRRFLPDVIIGDKPIEVMVVEVKKAN